MARTTLMSRSCLAYLGLATISSAILSTSLASLAFIEARFAQVLQVLGDRRRRRRRGGRSGAPARSRRMNRGRTSSRASARDGADSSRRSWRRPASSARSRSRPCRARCAVVRSARSRCVLPAPDWPWNSRMRSCVPGPLPEMMPVSRSVNLRRALACTSATSTGSARQMSSSQVIDCSNAENSRSGAGCGGTSCCCISRRPSTSQSSTRT